MSSRTELDRAIQELRAIAERSKEGSGESLHDQISPSLERVSEAIADLRDHRSR